MISRSTIQFRLKDEDERDGLILELWGNDAGFYANAVPQAGFRCIDSSKREYVKLSDLESASHELPSGIDRQDVRIVCHDAEEQALVEAALQRRGIPFEERSRTTLAYGQQRRVRIEAEVRDSMLRCVGKIAVNYLEARFPGIVLSNDFDPIRRYVRYGEVPSSLPVTFTSPALPGVVLPAQPHAGHVLSLQWEGNDATLTCRMQLFGQVVYRVELTNSFSSLWRPIGIAEHFDLVTRAISPLKVLGAGRIIQ